MKVKKCEEILELLSLYIDNELDDETSKIVKEHVELCSSCKDELVQLQQVVKMCNEADEVELPDNFNEVLHQKLKLEHKKMEDDKKITVMRNRILKTITSVAAIFIVIFAVRGIMNIEMQMNDVSSTKNGESMKPNSVMNERDRENDLSAQSANGILAYEENFDKEIGNGSYTDRADGTKSEDKGDVKLSLHLTEDIAAKDEINDPKADVRIAEGDDQNEATYSMDNVPEEGVELIITLTATTENIESDKLKISKLADKFGTKTEVSELNSLYATEKEHSFDGEISKYSTSYDDSFYVSYSMNKASYEKFIKEIEDNYSGEYSVTNDVEHLNGRLKEIDKRIKELEKNKSVNTDEYKILSYDKEGIMKQLDNLNLNNNIRVDIRMNSD